MIAQVSFAEVTKVLIAGATFIPLALVLGYALSRFGLTIRDSRGALRKGPCALIVLSLSVLVFAHAMAVWFIAPSAFHPAMNGFYLVGGVLATRATRTKLRSTTVLPRASGSR
jgi:protein-S-isoprenylcysteine O-methyltransferase Ste14